MIIWYTSTAISHENFNENPSLETSSFSEDDAPNGRSATIQSNHLRNEEFCKTSTGANHA